MKKTLFAILFSLLLIFPAFGATENEDIILMLDESSSMFTYFDDVRSYIVEFVVKNYLKQGDSFHLISFSDKAETVVSKLNVRSKDDISEILGTIHLLLPLGKYSDLLNGLHFLVDSFIPTLPSYGEPKTIIIVTDGIQNASPSSPYSKMSADMIDNEVNNTVRVMREKGWKVFLIRVPNDIFTSAKNGTVASPSTSQAANAESSSENSIDIYPSISESLGVPITEFDPKNGKTNPAGILGIPTLVFPGYLGRQDYEFTLSFTITNTSDKELSVELRGILYDGSDILKSSTPIQLGARATDTLSANLKLPSSMAEGEKQLPIELLFFNDLRTEPTSGTISLKLEKNPFAFLKDTGTVLIIVIVFVAFLALIGVFIYTLRRVHKHSEANVIDTVQKSIASDSLTAAAKAMRATEAMSANAQASLLDEYSKNQKAKETLPLKSQTQKPASDKARADELANTARSTGIKSQSDENRLPLKSELAKASADSAAKPGNKESKAQEKRVESHAASYYEPKANKPGKIQLEFVVDEQNRNIGMRNIHLIESGQRKTIGGGSSDFLVFLFDMPTKMAELHFDGERLVFVPLRLDFFPNIKGPTEICLDQEIDMVNKRDVPMKARFRVYEKPEEQLNRLLHCIDIPGLFQK